MEAAFGLLLFLLLFYLVMIGFAIACYVLQSLGMYTIAKRRGIHHPWLAWVPVGASWLLGSISDQYHYVAKGEEKSKRKILLGLEIAVVVMYIGFFACWIWALVNIIQTSSADVVDEMQVFGTMMGPFMAMYGIGLAMFVVAIVMMVFQYIALYDLYNSCSPDNSTLFLVLSIVFGVVQPFLIFSVRNKDLGMPPRQHQNVATQPVAEAQPVVVPPPVVVEPPVELEPPVEETPVDEEPPTVVEETDE